MRKVFFTSFLILLFQIVNFSQVNLDYSNFDNANLNGWTLVNGMKVNIWTIGGAQSYFDQFSRIGVYISNDGGTTNNYDNNNASIVHLYKDIPITSVNYDMLLTFKLKCSGEDEHDYFSVHAVSPSITPVAGEELTEGQLGRSEYSGSDFWRGYTMGIKRSDFTENYFRLVFTWTNDANGTGDHAAAIDNIRLSEMNSNYGVWNNRVQISPKYYGGNISTGYTTYLGGGDVTGGGVGTNLFQEFCSDGGELHTLPAMPDPIRLNEMAKFDGKIISIGGYKNGQSEPTNESYEFNLSDFSWSTNTNFSGKIFYHRLATYKHKVLYSIGGSDETNTLLNKVYYLQKGQTNWLEATPMPGDGHADGGAAIVKNEIFYTVGFTNSSDFPVQVDSTFVGTIDTTDPSIISWKVVKSFPGGHRARLRAIPWGPNKVLVIGGVDDGNFQTATIFNDVWEYNLDTDEWNQLANIPFPICAYMGGSQRLGSNLRCAVITGGITTGPALSGQTIMMIDTVQSVTKVERQVDQSSPQIFVLEQNYPNPFNPSTTIRFSIPEQTYVKLEIFNALGEKVSALVSEELNSGTYKYKWNAANLTSGIYFYTLTAGNFIKTRKLILLK